MRKLLVISMAFVMLALIFSGCENAGESGSSITQSEAEAGLAEVGTNIEKASAAPPSSDTTSDDGSTNTITYNNVSYDGSIIDGTIEVTGTDSDMTISFDSLAVDSYIINGSMNMKFTAIDDSTYQVDFTSTINITGGTVSTISHDVTVTIETDENGDPVSQTVTGSITVDGKSFDAENLSNEGLPPMGG